MATTTVQEGLAKQTISLSLTGGIDRKTDSKQLTNGQMYTADNVQYITEKQIRKRFGYMPLTPPGGLQGAPFAAVGCRDNIEPLVLGTGYLNRYNPVTGLSTTIPANTQGRLSAVNITASSGIGTAPCPPISSSCATDGQKYTLVTWEEIDGSTANMFYGIQDLLTGSWIISPQQIPQSTNGTFVGSDQRTYTITNQFSPRAFYCNGYFYILLEFAGSNNTNGALVYGACVEAYAINLYNLAAGLLTTNLVFPLLSNQSTAEVASGPKTGWDAVLFNGILYIGVAYNRAGVVQTYSMSGQTITNTYGGGAFTTPATSANTYYRISMATDGNSIGITTNSSLYVLNFTAATTNLNFETDFTYTSVNNLNIGSTTAYTTATLFVNGVYYAFNMGIVPGTNYAQYLYVTGVSNVAGSRSQIVFTGIYPGPSTSVASGIVSRPWYYNGHIYIWMFGSGSAGWGVFREQVLLEINIKTGGLNYVARTGYQTAGLVNQPYSMVPVDVINIPGTEQYLSYLTQTTDVVGGAPGVLPSGPTTTSPNAPTQVAIPAVISNQFYGVLTRTQFDFTPSTPSSIVGMPTGGVMITGALPQTYDGQALIEAGYSTAPELVTAPLLPPSGNGGNGDSGKHIAAGTYTYYACFCRRDAYGNIIRSSPSSPFIVTLTGSSSYVVFAGIYYSRAPGTYLEYYRTTVASPQQPQLVAKVQNGAVFDDTTPDASLANQPTIYTYSGEYPNDPPPAIQSIAFGETRAYLIPSDARNSLWCSKKYSPGRSVEWTTNLILSEGGTNNGQFTAVAVLDANVIVFKQDQILYFTGDGPDNAGATGSFTAFTKLSSDVGCIDPGSLAIIPGGLLFRSQRGIELLSRGLQVSYVGFPIEPLIQNITTIASTCVLPKYQQVRFVSSNVGDPVLVYDYLSGRWSTYSGMNSVSCANVQGNYWWVSADGTQCNVETPGQFTDNGNFIPMTLETPEITMKGLQGWGRLYRFALLGEYKTPHTLSTSFAYDHAETYTDTVTYSVLDASVFVPFVSDAVYYDANSSQTADIVTPPCPEQFRMSRVPRQVMQTVRFRLQDTPFNGYYTSDGGQVQVNFTFGESCSISNITLEVGQKAAIAKLSGGKSV